MSKLMLLTTIFSLSLVHLTLAKEGGLRRGSDRLGHKKGWNDTMSKLILIATIFSLFLVHLTLAEEETMSWPPTFIHSRIAVTPGGYHATTRGMIRLVFPHEGRWLVFRGGPDTYHFSEDGITWTATEAPQASRSHMIDGNTIYSSYNVLVEPAPKWIFDRFICRGTISGKEIRWEEPYKLDTQVDYYRDLKQDTNGYFTMTGRGQIRDENDNVIGMGVLWKRSTRPNDISEWGPDVPYINRTGDGPIEGDRDSWKKIGSTVHENLVLEDGKSYAFAMMTVDGVGRLYGNLYDGEKWGEKETEIATGMSSWAGTDRRMCAVFDKTAKVIHLAYVDGDGDLFYHSAKTPYGPNDWSEPVQLHSFKTFTVILSLDTSHQPNHVYVLFGKTLFEDSNDLRNTYAELYLQRFDGQLWSEPVLVSEPGTEDNWYPNMNADLRHGVGILYLKGAARTRPTPPGEKTPLDIMFASTGAPKKVSKSEASLPGVTDVLVDGENCRGAHVTTRPHNRKVVYHAPSETWFVFYGTGHWLDKLGDAGLEKEMMAWRASSDGQTFSAFAPAVVGNGHSSSADVLLVGNRIFLTETRWGYWRQKAGVPWKEDGEVWYYRSTPDQPMFFVPFEVFPFDIVGDRLIAGQPAEALPGDKHVSHAGPHYGSMTRDTNGYLWVAARAMADVNGLATWVARTTRPDDIADWEPHTALFKSAGPGTHAPQILALDEGRVACVLFAKHEQMTVVYVYDPDSRSWGEPQVIGKGYESKRACAVFDPGSRRLHVVYTDSAGDARHRALSDPYGSADWSPPLDEPGTLAAEKAGANKGDDDLSLSVDISNDPAPLALVHRGPDLRLHLRYYDGRNWSPKDVKIGLQDPAWNCDEASAVADFSHGLGFVYWCQWKDPKVKEQKDGIGQLRFCLVKDVAGLFAGR